MVNYIFFKLRKIKFCDKIDDKTFEIALIN